MFFCDSYNDIDGIFEEEVTGALRRINCDPVMPRDLKAKRSLIVKSCGAMVYDRDVSEIREEIERVNNLKVCEAFKLPNFKALKVVLKSQKMVTDACEKGLFLFNLYISPRFLVQDSYMPLLMCYKCYAYESHIASACPKDSNYKVCSLCSCTTHIYSECRSIIKRCLHCQGSHPTNASVCPIRKKFLQKKNEKTPYAHVVKNKPTDSSIPCEDINVQNIMSKSFVCFLLAACKERENSGTFNSVLNSLLVQNNLPSIKMQGISPPSLSTLLNSVEAENIVNKDESSSSELCQEIADVKKMSEVSSHSPVGSGAKAKKKMNKRPQIVIYRKRSGPKKITELNIERLVKDRKVALKSSLSINDSIGLLQSDIQIADIADVANDVFNNCLEDMLTEENYL